MPRQEGPPVIMDEIPRTYYPGRGFLTDQEAYPTEPFIFLPRKNKDRLTQDIRYDDPDPRIIPMPYPFPIPGNQGNNQGGFNVGKALGAMAGYLGMGFGNPAFTPGPILSGRYSDLMKEKTFPDLLASSPSFDLSYGRGRDGTSLEGIPNANDPVMRKKLRDRLLKNPAGTESLPGFLGKV